MNILERLIICFMKRYATEYTVHGWIWRNIAVDIYDTIDEDNDNYIWRDHFSIGVLRNSGYLQKYERVLQVMTEPKESL